MTNKDIKNTLYKIGCKKIAFNLWGLFGGNWAYLNKEDIKDIKNHLNNATKEEQNQLKKYINQWCESFRCYSLIIK